MSIGTAPLEERLPGALPMEECSAEDYPFESWVSGIVSEFHLRIMIILFKDSPGSHSSRGRGLDRSGNSWFKKIILRRAFFQKERSRFVLIEIHLRIIIIFLKGILCNDSSGGSSPSVFILKNTLPIRNKAGDSFRPEIEAKKKVRHHPHREY